MARPRSKIPDGNGGLIDFGRDDVFGLSPDIAKALISQAGGLLIALVILVGLYRLAHKFGEAFLKAQRAQAEALGKQAQSMTDLHCTLSDYFKRDNTEHREILILQKLTVEKLQNMGERLQGMEGKIGR